MGQIRPLNSGVNPTSFVNAFFSMNFFIYQIKMNFCYFFSTMVRDYIRKTQKRDKNVIRRAVASMQMGIN